MWSLLFSEFYFFKIIWISVEFWKLQKIIIIFMWFLAGLTLKCFITFYSFRSLLGGPCVWASITCNLGFWESLHLNLAQHYLIFFSCNQIKGGYFILMCTHVLLRGMYGAMMTTVSNLRVWNVPTFWLHQVY